MKPVSQSRKTASKAHWEIHVKTWLKEFETNAFYFVFKKFENNKHTYVIDTQSSFKYPVFLLLFREY